MNPEPTDPTALATAGKVRAVAAKVNELFGALFLQLSAQTQLLEQLRPGQLTKKHREKVDALIVGNARIEKLASALRDPIAQAFDQMARLSTDDADKRKV